MKSLNVNQSQWRLEIKIISLFCFLFVLTGCEVAKIKKRDVVTCLNNYLKYFEGIVPSTKKKIVLKNYSWEIYKELNNKGVVDNSLRIKFENDSDTYTSILSDYENLEKINFFKVMDTTKTIYAKYIINNVLKRKENLPAYFFFITEKGRKYFEEYEHIQGIRYKYVYVDRVTHISEPEIINGDTVCLVEYTKNEKNIKEWVNTHFSKTTIESGKTTIFRDSLILKDRVWKVLLRNKSIIEYF